MTTISKDALLVTFINVFTVDPSNQRRLVELLARATETSVRHAPGFISASLHRSLDGTKVTMYAQWRTIEDYEAMRGNPGPAPFLEQALAISASSSAGTRSSSRGLVDPLWRASWPSIFPSGRIATMALRSLRWNGATGEGVRASDL